MIGRSLASPVRAHASLTANVAIEWQYMWANSSASPPRLPLAPCAAAEVVEPAGDVVGVGPFAVRVPGAQERQQRQGGHAGVGAGAGGAAVFAEHVALLPGAEPLGVPAAVLALRGGEPGEGGADGALGRRVAAAAGDQRVAIGEAAGVRRWNCRTGRGGDVG